MTEKPGFDKPVPAPVPPDVAAGEVPEDFAERQAKLLETQLSPEEIAEFRALRQEKKDRDKAAADAAAEAAARLSPPTHNVALADGSVVDGSTIETHYATERGDLVPAVGAFLKSDYVNLLT